MKFLALRWTCNGVEHCLVDSVNAGNVEERHRFMRAAFPGNLARLEMIEVPDTATADTLPPPIDPFAIPALEQAVREARAEMPTLPETKRDCVECDHPQHMHGALGCSVGAYSSAPCACRRTQYTASWPQDSLVERDRARNRKLGGGG